MERKRKYNLYISDPTHDVPVRSKHRSKKTVSLDASPLPTLQNGSAQSPDLVSVVASEETLCDRSHPPVNDDCDCSGKSVESACIKSPDPTDVDSPNTDTSSESSDAETSEDEAHAFGSALEKRSTLFNSRDTAQQTIGPEIQQCPGFVEPPPTLLATLKGHFGTARVLKESAAPGYVRGKNVAGSCEWRTSANSAHSASKIWRANLFSADGQVARRKRRSWVHCPLNRPRMDNDGQLTVSGGREIRKENLHDHTEGNVSAFLKPDQAT
ncbi:hypothetical protein MRX96_056828 [Rhipicephalus microplus]